MTVLAALLAMFAGGFTGHMATKTTTYCECYRTNFDGAYCKSIMGSGAQGSCHK